MLAPYESIIWVTNEKINAFARQVARDIILFVLFYSCNSFIPIQVCTLVLSYPWTCRTRRDRCSGR